MLLCNAGPQVNICCPEGSVVGVTHGSLNHLVPTCHLPCAPLSLKKWAFHGLIAPGSCQGWGLYGLVLLCSCVCADVLWVHINQYLGLAVLLPPPVSSASLSQQPQQRGDAQGATHCSEPISHLGITQPPAVKNMIQWLPCTQPHPYSPFSSPTPCLWTEASPPFYPDAAHSLLLKESSFLTQQPSVSCSKPSKPKLASKLHQG